MAFRGLDKTVPSLLVVLMGYCSSVACPFPWGRLPEFAGGRHYGACVIYQIFASPIMLTVALRLDSAGALPGPMLWTLLVGGTVVLLTGMALMAFFMVPEYRKTFYEVSVLVGGMRTCIDSARRL